MPEGALHARLSELIQDLAGTHAGVPFEPHVTLLGGLEGPEAALLERARELAARLRPFDVELGAAATGHEPFHCVFLEVASGPRLREAHALARSAFGVGGEAAFAPHLSLLYGSLEEPQRQAARRAAGRVDAAFQADALDVVDTAGDVVRWRRLARCPFSGT